MSNIGIRGELSTTFKDNQFLYFAENSGLGIILIQRGHLIYFNKKFTEIFGYTQEEISSWKKREFYKIVHPEDLKKLVQNFKIEDDRTLSIRFRGIHKNGNIISIENYVCRVVYNNKNTFLSSYVLLSNHFDNNSNLRERKIKFEIELPTPFKKFFKYVELHFGISTKKYIEKIIKNEINSRNSDLNLM